MHPGSPEEFLRVQGLSVTQKGTLDVCTEFTCASSSTITPAESFWSDISDLMRTAARSAEAEREGISAAVARFETLAGTLAGYRHDLPKNRRERRPGQLDCIAETANTTMFLLELQRRNLLRHHQVDIPAHRGFLILSAHNTATIVERNTSIRFAVDSWYGHNGQQPHIVPLDQWLAGWTPENAAPIH